MALLKRLGYHGLSLREALPYVEGRKSGKIAAITFDDGFTNVLENAGPILAEFEFTATNFIVATQIGGWNEWDSATGVASTDCMTGEQIGKWLSLGHEIGSHTLSHVDLTAVSDQEAARQISISREILSALIGQAIDGFAYPYGAQSVGHRAMAENAGYKYAVSTERRSATAGDDIFALPRLTIRRNDTWPQFLLKCLCR